MLTIPNKVSLPMQPARTASQPRAARSAHRLHLPAAQLQLLQLLAVVEFHGLRHPMHDVHDTPQAAGTGAGKGAGVCMSLVLCVMRHRLWGRAKRGQLGSHGRRARLAAGSPVPCAHLPRPLAPRAAPASPRLPEEDEEGCHLLGHPPQAQLQSKGDKNDHGIKHVPAAAAHTTGAGQAREQWQASRFR